MNELWKHARGYENLYLVSNLGRVKAVTRIVTRSNGRPYTINSKILKPAQDSCGYLRVALMKNGKLNTEKVHRLVAKTFLVDDYSLEVNHIDGDKQNNNVDNLEFLSRSQNQKHAFKIGLQKPKLGSSNPSAKIDEIKVLTIKTLIKCGYKLKKISNGLNISYHIVKDINRNKTWKHINV